MKRIIELPDEVVKAIQNGEDYRYDIHTAIAQSTPYNPTGDLISREALKKDFENLASDDYNEPIWYQKTVFETIDNAPTVDIPKPNCVTCDHFGECEGCEKREEE